MRLIDADALIKNILKSDSYNDYEWSLYADEIIDDKINAAPTIEPKRGEWELFYESKDGDNVYECSCCRFMIVIPEGIKLFSFCPNCGAKMGEREDE